MTTHMTTGARGDLFDSRQRQLHLLPALQTDPFDKVEAADITLSVEASWMEGSLLPRGGISVRQPYPNPLFFVAGSEECHLGWFVPLPEGITGGELVFHWQVTAPHVLPGHFSVRHELSMVFEEGQGNTWSMDIANYWGKSEFSDCHSVSEIGRNRFSRLRGLGISHRREAEVVEGREGGGDLPERLHVKIRESLKLPAIRLDECWTVTRYGGPYATRVLEQIR